MILPVLILLQTAAPLDVQADRRTGVDLPAGWRPANCPTGGDGSDIVVCGRRDGQEQFRLRPLPEPHAPIGGPGVGVDLGKGVRGNLYTEQGGAISGQVSKRVMVRVTMPF